VFAILGIQKEEDAILVLLIVGDLGQFLFLRPGAFVVLLKFCEVSRLRLLFENLRLDRLM
jgi:hypothetical protein